MPDGETGERRLWIRFQQKMLGEHPAIETDPTQPPLAVRQSDGTILRHIQLVRLKSSVDPDQIEFSTGYDLAAWSSYQVFRQMRRVGTIPPHIRFQVALPTPMQRG